MNNIDNIIDYINGSNYFVVTSHISPDGDNIGSTLSMYYALNKLGKNVFYVLDDNSPLNLRFLLKLSEDMRKAIQEDRFLEFKKEFMEKYGKGKPTTLIK